MSWHGAPLDDAANFGANRRDSQRTLTRRSLAGALVVVCLIAVPALVAFSEESSTTGKGSDLAARDAQLSAAKGKTQSKDKKLGAAPTARSHKEISAIIKNHKALHDALVKHALRTKAGGKKAPESHSVESKSAHSDRGKPPNVAAAKSNNAHGDAGKTSSVAASSKPKRQAEPAAKHAVEHHGTERKGQEKKPVKKAGAEKGSTAWEREQDDSFFDSLDKQRTRQEETHLSKYQKRTANDDAQRRQSVKAEHVKVEKEYLDAKKRFAAQQAAAKEYTKRTFAAMESHRSNIEHDSESGFKSMEAKELATEVERDHPDESAQQIAQRAMKLLKVVMHGGSALPTVPASAGPGPPLAPLGK